MLDIATIKTEMKSILAEAYKNANVPTKKNDNEIEGEGFMRAQDAAAIRDKCASSKLTVSFRNAGADTIARIKEGNPCKGHDILAKTIKRTEDRWTYQEEENRLARLRGYVGSPYIPLDVTGNINLKDPKFPPLVIPDTNGNIKKLIFHLDDIFLVPVELQPKEKIGIGFIKKQARSLSETDLKYAYTGDYDMHDLINAKGRCLAGSLEELNAIDLLNNAMLTKDNSRRTRVEQLPKNAFSKTSPYALIRHGAQTSYLDYLTTNKGTKDLLDEICNIRKSTQKSGNLPGLPFGSTVVKVDKEIVLFNTKKEAYITSSVGEVYKLYEFLGLLNYIPFYNFFDDLSTIPEYTDKIAGYSSYIYSIFATNLGLKKPVES